MPPRRPGTVTASAVMSIAYGALFGLCGLCGLIGLAAGTAGGFGGNDPQNVKVQKEMEDAVEKEIPHNKTIQIVGNVLGLLEAMALLIGGIGLLGMNSWARSLVMAAALVAIISTLLQAGFVVLVTAPATKKAFKDIEAKLEQQDVAARAKEGKKGQPADVGPPPAAVMQMVELVLTITFVIVPIIFVVFAIYLAVIVALLMSRSARRAFAGGPYLDDRHDDREDDRDFRRRDNEDDDRGRRDDDRRDDDRFRDERGDEKDDRFR